jgi:hypothetical protein
MNESGITFVVNGNAYSLRPNDGAAAGAIPAADRQQLIALLETVKEAERTADRIAESSRQKVAGAGPGNMDQIKPERLGAGDADALMARLVMEENRHKKAIPTRQGFYKWMAVFAFVVILLVVVF